MMGLPGSWDCPRLAGATELPHRDWGNPTAHSELWAAELMLL